MVPTLNINKFCRLQLLHLIISLAISSFSTASVGISSFANWRGQLVLYFAPDVGVEFTDARQLCNNWEGELPIIHSQKDLEELSQVLKQTNLYTWLAGAKNDSSIAITNLCDEEACCTSLNYNYLEKVSCTALNSVLCVLPNLNYSTLLKWFSSQLLNESSHFLLQTNLDLKAPPNLASEDPFEAQPTASTRKSQPLNGPFEEDELNELEKSLENNSNIASRNLTICIVLLALIVLILGAILWNIPHIKQHMAQRCFRSLLK